MISSVIPRKPGAISVAVVEYKIKCIKCGYSEITSEVDYPTGKPFRPIG